MSDNIVFLGCGDVAPVHEPMAPYSTLARPVLATGDIRFGQCERLYTTKGERSAHGSTTSRLAPHMISLFGDCGFNVVSLACNHVMDWGADAMLDTKERLQAMGIQVIGAGRNLREARQPAIIEKNGVRVAVLAYCSVLMDGYAAEANKAGAAPLRVHTSYEPYEYQAGVPPRIITVPFEEDMAGMAEDIANAKKSCHAVVVSMHWGVHYIPRLIAEYQPIAAKAAFKAGADLIVGHHPHVPKAIEMIDGKACFYSVGNFIMSDFSASKPGFKEKFKRYGVVPDVEEFPKCPMGKDSKHSLIAKAVISKAGVDKVSFLPVQIDRELRPEVLRRSDPRFDTVVNFMDSVSEDHHHNFKIEGDEVVLQG
jgi:Bacterial capsule synthesis protein PGA_cap